MLCIVWTWTIGYFFGHLFSCFPVTVFIEAYYGNKCFNQVPMFLSVAISGTIIDFLILSMPIPIIMGLQLPMQQKIGVMGILLLGAVVCSVSIARVVALYEVAGQYLLHPNDGICKSFSFPFTHSPFPPLQSLSSNLSLISTRLHGPHIFLGKHRALPCHSLRLSPHPTPHLGVFPSSPPQNLHSIFIRHKLRRGEVIPQTVYGFG
jgi:hypothetical protein